MAYKKIADMGCTCYRLRLAARRASRIYDRRLAPCGISIAQFALLGALEANDGASVTALASMLEMDRTSLTRNLQPLERDGLVRVDPGPDQRTRAVRLTEAGRSTLARAKPLWREAQDSIEASLGSADLAILHASLDDALDRLPED